MKNLHQSHSRLKCPQKCTKTSKLLVLYDFLNPAQADKQYGYFFCDFSHLYSFIAASYLAALASISTCFSLLRTYNETHSPRTDGLFNFMYWLAVSESNVARFLTNF